MFNRISAKEKSKTLLRTRSLADAIGMAVIQVAVSGASAIAVSPLVQAGLAALGVGSLANVLDDWNLFDSLYDMPDSLWGVLRGVGVTTFILLLGAAFIILCIRLLFRAGMNRSALRMNRGDQSVRVVDILLAGDRLGTYIRITLWQVLFFFLWNLPSAAASMIALFLLIPTMVPVLKVLAVLLLVAAIAWRIYISVRKYCEYYFAYLICEDNRDMAALTCVQESVRLMHGHVLDLFVAMLSFIGWNIVAHLPCGSVFVTPYQYLTYASLYEQLTEGFRPAPRRQMLWLDNGSENCGSDLPSGASQGSSERKVEVISGEFAGSSFPVKPGEEIRIGRDPAQANVVTSPSNTLISGLHCTIRYDAQQSMYVVTDHSTNGTSLNNRSIASGKSACAQRGSIVRLADGVMILRLS